MDIEELKRQYASIPAEMQSMRHWVGYKTEERNGQLTKVPYNAISGNYAKSNDPATWTSFNVAINGVVKYGFEGIGFMFGDGIFGIDLDNHPDAKTGEYAMTQEEFMQFAQEFIDGLNSYTEFSRSKKGIHIICRGKLPEGRRRKGCVEMYDHGRFFACTGYTIKSSPVMERSEEIIPLWKKYVDDSEELRKIAAARAASPLGDMLGTGSGLTDAEVVEKASNSRNGGSFSALMNGDMSAYQNDHSGADIAFCSMLAFWCNGDADQMDRIFRSSALMREKWDTMRGSRTYGQQTIEKAIASMTNGYQKQDHIERPKIKIVGKEETEEKPMDNFMNLSDDGEPIFRPKKVFKTYPYTDTGNAECFFDQFGDVFHYNVDAKMWMIWTGKTWEFDKKDIIRKYANELIDIRKKDYERILEEAKKAAENGEEDKQRRLLKTAEASKKNIERISNKAGKDAMMAEMQAIHKIPVLQTDFDKDIYTLNTDSGIVDLRTGIISAFDKERMLSKNTHVGVSFDYPETWMKFLKGVFYRGDGEEAEQETQEIIDCMQMALGLSLTGDTREQTMFLLYGSGSNGKSTLMELLAYIMGDYCKTIDSNMLMAKAAMNASVQFSLAELVGCRFLITKETDEGDKLAEGTVKSLTGSDQINAQQKYGRPFQFMPQFKLWMMTNNLPVIRGTDRGIWRRIFLVPFEHAFTDKEKDLDMPNKLRKEADKILGWCIQGYIKYVKSGERLIRPKCLSVALEAYKGEMDVVSRFIDRFCIVDKENPFLKTERQELYNAFDNYARSNNEFALREPKFCRNIVESKGFNMFKAADGDWYYYGISLNKAAQSLKKTTNYHDSLFNKGE